MGAKRIALIAVLVLCLLPCACGPAAPAPALRPTPEAPTVLPTQALPAEHIVDLLEQETITYTLTSGSINQLGLEIRNTSDRDIQVAIPAGTFFINADPESQNMVVVHDASLALSPAAAGDVLLAVACANLHLSEPTQENSFTIERDPTPATLTYLIDRLNDAGAEYPVQQAAIWIVTDDAAYDELGMLVKDTRFGQSVITEDDALQALKAVDETGINIHRLAIWEDFSQLAANISDPQLTAWVADQQATQTVLSATQAVLKATRMAADATDEAIRAAQWALEETQFVQTETALAPVETPLPTVAFATAEPGAISQFAVQASASSQYSDSSWSAMQATGAPNTSDCGDLSSAWASRSSSATDWLLLSYDQAVIPGRIVIFETFNPGAVTRVEVLDEAGNPLTVYSKQSGKSNRCPNQLVIEVTGVTVPIKSVRLTLEHKVWSEIDAVQLIGVTAQ